MDFSTSSSLLNKLLNILPDIFQNSVYTKYLEYWPILLIGALAALILTPIVGHIAMKYDITYKPGVKRKEKDFENEKKAIHEGITPALGGLALTIPVLIAILFFFKLDSFSLPIVLAIAILIIGTLLDDIFNLSAKTQLIYQLIASSIIAFSVINLTNLSFLDLKLDLYTWNFSIFSLEQSLALPGDILLIIWFLICINAVKWTAGSPGIIEANSLIVFSLIFIIAVRFHSVFSATTSIMMVGGLSIFLIFALPPQKIMTGSSGKTIYGLLICTLALIADSKLSTTIMLLALPVIDFAYVIVKRIVTYKPKNLIELMRISDTSHLHHQLMKLNLSRKQIVLIEMAVSLFIGSIAVLTTGAFQFFAVILILAICIIFIAYVNIKASKKEKDQKKEESPESKYSY
ncbi:glycosyltransferase family 4 protein [Candidatus Microgenomates bacterium]|jgi:UDP-GlcNAc:undecaprenyl-phosphate GlcNAc-1-phosphate transferase|nr:glycosyltransferase family 4 protein [Candidatus Microgenomates bacterium]